MRLIASSKITTMQQPAGYMPCFTKLKATKVIADIGMHVAMHVLKTILTLVKSLMLAFYFSFIN
jgi:hypothetical protein